MRLHTEHGTCLGFSLSPSAPLPQLTLSLKLKKNLLKRKLKAINGEEAQNTFVTGLPTLLVSEFIEVKELDTELNDIY